MKVSIEISEEIYKVLLKDVVTFKDTPDTVLRRWAQTLGKIEKNPDEFHSKMTTNPRIEISGKKPFCFRFLDKSFEVRNWVDVLIEICAIQARNHKKDFQKIFELCGPVWPYFSKKPEELMAGQCQKIPGTDIYAGTKYSAQTLVERCYKVIRIFGYSDNDFEVQTSTGKRTLRSSPLNSIPHSEVEGTGKFIENHRYTGGQLNRKYGLGVKQARYHKDGHFYEKLSEFPAALCDPDGYVIFKTEEEYLKNTNLNRGQKLNVLGGISNLPKYTLFPKD